MKVVDSYLATMFAPYPQTPKFVQARHDLRLMMEDQVEGLMSEGLTETQALGKVIAEFGSLDEVSEELGLNEELAEYHAVVQPQISSKPNLPLDTVRAYWNEVHTQAPRRATGVALYLLAPAFLMFCLAMGGLWKQGRENGKSNLLMTLDPEPVMLIVGLTGLLVLVALGVVLSRLAQAPLKRIVDVETESFSLAPDTAQWLKKQTKDQGTQNTLLRSIAVVLFIVSSLAVIIPSVLDSSESAVLFGVGILLVLVAVGVWLLNYKGSAEKAEEDLLRGERDADDFDFSDSSSPAIRILGAIYWPLLIAIFFIWGFVFDGWGSNWVVFPVGGVIYWALSEAASAYDKEAHQNT